MNRLELVNENKTNIIIEVNAPLADVNSFVDLVAESMGLDLELTPEELIHLVGELTKQWWFDAARIINSRRAELAAETAKEQTLNAYQEAFENSPLKNS